MARPVIPAIFAFHSAILGALRYRAAPKLFGPSSKSNATHNKMIDGLSAARASPPEVPATQLL